MLEIGDEDSEQIAEDRARAEDAEKRADAGRGLKQIEPADFARDRDDDAQVVDARVGAVQLAIVGPKEVPREEKVRTGFVRVVLVREHVEPYEIVDGLAQFETPVQIAFPGDFDLDQRAVKEHELEVLRIGLDHLKEFKNAEFRTERMRLRIVLARFEIGFGDLLGDEIVSNETQLRKLDEILHEENVVERVIVEFDVLRWQSKPAQGRRGHPDVVLLVVAIERRKDTARLIVALVDCGHVQRGEVAIGCRCPSVAIG